ncbi:Peptidase A1 [Cordyceps fumosorosea ARSEF 2679]|uniref:Peptidase A1 n=1 Tax=Cordyceps fumosorosea (strain ARSEF 2679) TaxID=1081104 RepID=A0A162I735_CORFA|nr:Peptidase A1 [Cordyceps fumosorosea ARSEF 2679]OAA53175.1 Peptidase A1 [Cordyceps fumosorosea ARSEF 2679]
MISSTAICLSLAAGSSATAAFSARESSVLSFPINKRHRPQQPILRRLSNGSEITLYNISGSDSYHIELRIGTPAQGLTLSGSQMKDCTSSGIFNPKSSVTLEFLRNGSSIQYAVGSAKFDYVKDDITLPGSSIALTSVQFGVGTNSSETSEGVMGLGFGNGKNLNYSNFIDALQDQGATKSQAFSVALGDVNHDDEGVIIFGGVDTKKFTGPLKQFNTLGKQTLDDTYRYYVQLETVGLTNSEGRSTTYENSSLPVLIDSGSTLSTLPAATLDNLAKDMGAKYETDLSQYSIGCDQFKTNATVDFAFHGLKIHVPYSQFLLHNGSSDCIIGAQRSNMSEGPPYYILGDTFMHSTYVVFDQSTLYGWPHTQTVARTSKKSQRAAWDQLTLQANVLLQVLP